MKKTTLAIGISVYNEEENISVLVASLLKQKLNNITLEKIYIISDGCTDKTVKKILRIKNRKICLTQGRKQLGKSTRLNFIFKKIKSDILVVFDGDVLPLNDQFIKHITSPIMKDSSIGLVGANILTAEPQSQVEKIIAHSHELKQYLYKMINPSGNIYLCHGRARAFAKKLYTKLMLPSDCPEDAYSYLYCLQKGQKFIFSPKAKVIFRSPATVNDHAKQNQRFIVQKDNLRSYFSEDFINQKYYIPPFIFLKTMLRFLLKKPFNTIGYILVNFYISIFMKKPTGSIIWEASVSSKRIVYD